MTDALVANLGWVATAVFTASYFFRRTELLRIVQMLGAGMWIGYGVANNAPPVIVANALVLTVAGVTTLRDRRTPSGAAVRSGLQNHDIPPFVPSDVTMRRHDVAQGERAIYHRPQLVPLNELRDFG